MRTILMLVVAIAAGCGGEGGGMPDAATSGAHVRVDGSICYEAWTGHLNADLVGNGWSTCDIACAQGPSATPLTMTGRCTELRPEQQQNVIVYEGVMGVCIPFANDRGDAGENLQFLPCDGSEPGWGG